MNEKCYLVVSVRELSRLSRLARRSSKAYRRGKANSNHCVVLRLDLLPHKEEHDGSNGERQLTGMCYAIERLKEEVARSEEVAPIVKQVRDRQAALEAAE